MSRYEGYQPYADIVNWGVYEAPFSLEEGRKMFPDAAILGGFANRTGIIAEGSIEELKARARQIVQEFGKTGFLIGADCTLATELPTVRVRAIVDAVREV
jgi:uroporphyrinogen decarboxylase